jgi:hypothetical protein
MRQKKGKFLNGGSNLISFIRALCLQLLTYTSASTQWKCIDETIEGRKFVHNLE